MLRRLANLIGQIFALFRAPPRRQVAALCWREGETGPEVLLVTTRRTKRWTPPKGWPMKKRTLAGAAAREAWEEAGAKGDIQEQAIGAYTYEKRTRHGGMVHTVQVEVFPMMVDRLEDEFPESGQRERRWMTPTEASDAVDEPGLKRLIANFPA